MKKYSCLIVTLLLLAGNAARAEIKVTVAHNGNDDASPQYHLQNVPAASDVDAASTAKFSIVDGTADENGGGLETLNDGKLPDGEDQPSENFFFRAGTDGGRLLVDLQKVIKVKQVNTYSWHPGSRGPQVYKLFASDGAAENFNAAPKRGTNPESCGWKSIASVNTKTKNADDGGGQYGVSIADTDGVIGNFRYFLFDISSTESSDPFGNTFYSEIDVVDADALLIEIKSEVRSAPPAPLVIKTADGKCEITFNTAKAPELKAWTETKLAPVLAEWYPTITAMLPSDGFTAPEKFTVNIKPMSGVAVTSGTRVDANSDWLKGELDGEAVGSLVHELVHVVQQCHNYGRADAPAWLIEGTADYIRWFKYEPQSHGADIVWMKQRGKKFSPKYDASYRITANFLDWVSKKHDAEIVRKLNAAMRDGKYNEALWEKYTGKPVEKLGAEWRKEIEKQLAAGDLK